MSKKNVYSEHPSNGRIRAPVGPHDSTPSSLPLAWPAPRNKDTSSPNLTWGIHLFPFFCQGEGSGRRRLVLQVHVCSRALNRKRGCSNTYVCMYLMHACMHTRRAVSLTALHCAALHGCREKEGFVCVCIYILRCGDHMYKGFSGFADMDSGSVRMRT
jgi:hypothetical protein